MGRIDGLTEGKLERIVKICLKNKVSRVKIADFGLEIDFYEQSDTKVANSYGKVSRKDPKEELLEEIRREAELDDLRFRDPLQYEEQIIKGEIKDGSR